MLVRQRLSYAILVAGILCAPVARAEKLSKGNKKWLKTVQHIILPDEEKTYKDLAQKDRKEFEKIFWARRDATLDTLKENEFKKSYEEAVKEADKRYRVFGRSGSSSDCGRVFILLGQPDDIADAVLALFCLDWVTGQTLACDGGITLHSPTDTLGL